MSRYRNYLRDLRKKVSEALKTGKFQPGQVYEVTVAHDDWCGIFKGGECDCSPEVREPGRIPRPEEN